MNTDDTIAADTSRHDDEAAAQARRQELYDNLTLKALVLTIEAAEFEAPEGADAVTARVDAFGVRYGAMERDLVAAGFYRLAAEGVFETALTLVQPGSDAQAERLSRAAKYAILGGNISAFKRAIASMSVFGTMRAMEHREPTRRSAPVDPDLLVRAINAIAKHAANATRRETTSELTEKLIAKPNGEAAETPAGGPTLTDLLPLLKRALTV